MNKKLMTEFSKWLKRFRDESKLSLMQLKAAIGDLCSDAYLSKLENPDKYKGKKGNPPRPDIEIVDALAVALRRPVDEARLLVGYAPKKAFDLHLAIAQTDADFTERQISEIVGFVKFKTQDQIDRQSKTEIEQTYGFNIKDISAKQPKPVSNILNKKPVAIPDDDEMILTDRGEIHVDKPIEKHRAKGGKKR